MDRTVGFGFCSGFIMGGGLPLSDGGGGLRCLL